LSAPAIWDQRAARDPRLDLLLDRVGDARHPRRQRGERALERAHDHRARAVRPGEHRQPARDGRHDRPVQQTLVRADVGHDEQRHAVHAVLAQTLQQVAADRRERLARHAVEDHRDARATLHRAAQGLPGERVAVARRRRDEQPQVRRHEQQARRLAVLRQERVEVGGVEQRGAARHAVVVDDARHARRRALDDHVGVQGVEREDGLARRRAQHAGLRHLLAEQRVVQRRLARAGGPGHHDHGRRRQLLEARQQVLVELGQQAVP
jgi:hypothetical protein